MAEKKVTDEGAQFYLPPPKLSKWEGFKQFMWNGERGEFMGRTGSSWGKVGLFYVIFYAGLAAFFSIMLVVFYQTLDNYEPKWQLGKSVIGTNPGLGFRPMPPESNIESTLIWFDHNQNRTKNHWIENLNAFLAPYDIDKAPGEYQECYQDPPSRDTSKACKFDVLTNLEGCSSASYYGYDKGRPCVAVKMNRIYGWTPDYFDHKDESAIQDTDTMKVPDEIRQKMRDHQANPKTNKYKMVWLYCEGENPADKENAGPIKYYPEQGFPEVFFPYTNQRGYLSPLVFIEFTEPEHGVLINVECRVYFHGVIHNRMERRGSVHFELLVD